jgi:TetR/AcrR family transcriptional regulator, transcriptional repressor for nem operon
VLKRLSRLHRRDDLDRPGSGSLRPRGSAPVAVRRTTREDHSRHAWAGDPSRRTARALCGISKSQLYHYFPDKAALVASLRNGDGGYRCPVGSLANELAGRSDSARRKLSGAFGTWTGDVASAFARLQESGELGSEVAAGDLALEVIAALQGGYLLAETMRDEQPFALALDMALGWVKAHARVDR